MLAAFLRPEIIVKKLQQSSHLEVLPRFYSPLSSGKVRPRGIRKMTGKTAMLGIAIIASIAIPAAADARRYFPNARLAERFALFRRAG